MISVHKTVTIKIRDLIFAALALALIFWGALEIISIRAELQSTKLTLQVQRNSENIIALDRALASVAKDVEELKKAK